jgi:hypothetical protein
MLPAVSDLGRFDSNASHIGRRRGLTQECCIDSNPAQVDRNRTLIWA